jgi:hypothetical protein
MVKRKDRAKVRDVTFLQMFGKGIKVNEKEGSV